MALDDKAAYPAYHSMIKNNNNDKNNINNNNNNSNNNNRKRTVVFGEKVERFGSRFASVTLFLIMGMQQWTVHLSTKVNYSFTVGHSCYVQSLTNKVCLWG